MEFNFKLSREERRFLIKGLYDQQDYALRDIQELKSMDITQQWVKEELIKAEHKYNELYALQIKLEG